MTCLFLSGFVRARNIASLTGSQWFQTVTNFSFMKNSKFRNVHGRTFLNDGIRAATESPQRTKSTPVGV